MQLVRKGTPGHLGLSRRLVIMVLNAKLARGGWKTSP